MMQKEKTGIKKTVVIISGGFDPIHPGHLDYIREARAMGDWLIVGLNSDEWLTRKKGRAFMCFDDRWCMLMATEGVDDVISFDDSDDTAIDLISRVMNMPVSGNVEYIFANGGDRDITTTPENSISTDNIKFRYGVGGGKSSSSSELLAQWSEGNNIIRDWGIYKILLQDSRIKVKELVIQPNKCISYQKHFLRSEIWFVSQGQCTVKHSKGKRTDYTMHNLREDDVFTVRANEWHQISNPYLTPCHIIEIQYGSDTSEEDIQRDE